MTLRSLVTIDVDDSAFDAWAAKFQAFQKNARISLGLSPLDLPGAGAGTEGAGGLGTPWNHDASLEDVVVALTDIKDLIKRLVAHDTHTHRDSGGGGGGFDAGISGGVSGGVLSFLRGGLGKLALGEAIAGLGVAAGLGALYEGGKFVLHGAGLGGHAADATALRTAAREANTSIGKYRAFQVDLAPYADGEQLLQSVAAVQSNIQNPGNIALQRAGVNASAHSDIGAVAILEQARQAYKDTRNNPRMLDTVLQQRQLTPFGIDASTARSVGSISDKEFAALLQSIQEDAKKFNVPDNTAQVWQQLNQAITRSAAQIDTVFTQTLPAAARAETIAIGFLTDKIAQAANVIDKNFPSLTSGVTPGTTLTQLGAGAKSDGAKVLQTFDPVGNAPNDGHHMNPASYYLTESWGATGAPDLPPKGFAWKDITQAPQKELNPSLQPYAWKNIATALGQTESGGDINAVSPVGAEGVWQIMPATLERYGYSKKQGMDPTINAQVSSSEWNRNLAEFGDPYKAAAAYNWGSGNLEKDIAAHGKDWDLNLPQETSDYIRSKAIAGRLNELNTGGFPIPRATTVTINNRSNTDAYIQGRLANR